MREIEVLCIYKGIPRFFTEDQMRKVLEMEGKKLVRRENHEVPNLSKWGVCAIADKEPGKWIPFSQFEEFPDKSITVIFYGSRRQLRNAFYNLTIIRNRGFAAQVTAVE